jgi:hypothetical protein
MRERRIGYIQRELTRARERKASMPPIGYSCHSLIPGLIVRGKSHAENYAASVFETHLEEFM